VVVCVLLQGWILQSMAFAQSGGGQSPVQSSWVMKPTLTAKTLPLYQMKDKYVSKGFKEAEEVKLPEWLKNPAPPGPEDKDFTDKAMQRNVGPQITLNLGLNFDGIGQGLTGPNGTYSVDSVPPDTDMAVGTTQVVSLGNTGFAVFDKTTGAATGGPYNTNILWSALGASAACDADNDGDAVVKFDQLAQRWIITQFAVTAGGTTGPFAQCIAISLTGDATGSYQVFQFNPVVNNGKNFPDYPKLGVWPNVYSMTFDMFNAAGTSYVGGGICGIDRVALLAGNNPTIVCAQLLSSDFALLPVDLDGSAYPPAANTKALYIENSDASSTSTSLFMYRAAYNFTAGTVTVDPRTTIAVSTYSNRTCTAGQGGTSKCVPQPTHTGAVATGEVFLSESKLDTLAAHEMFRAAYRNFGGYESITLSGPVLPSSSGGAGSNTAERWYEIRTPFGTPTVFQQSTYSPETTLYRWMGSIAQDHQGNMAMGYSGSSSTVFPSVYVTGRLNGDTINTMGAETQLFAGLNSQVNVTIGGTQYAFGYRWGDYSAMMVDPDDCTFWYTGEYLQQAGEFNWSTRMLSFAFPGCTSTAAITMPVPSSTLSGSSANFLWTQGTGSPTYHVDIGSTQGGTDYYSQDQGTATQAAVGTLPTDGSTVFARLTQTVGGTPTFTDYTYATLNLGPAIMTSPVNTTTLTGPSATFTWRASAVATAYWIDAGSVAGGNQYYQSGSMPTTTLSATVNSLPTDGSIVYVTLYSLIGGQWMSNAYTYTAYNNASTKGVVTSPAPNSMLSWTSVPFTWSAGTGATAYWIDAGTVAGGNQYYQSGNLGNVLGTTVSGLPSNGSTVFVTLYTFVGGQWLSNAYTYTAFNAAAAGGVIQTPVPASTLTSGTVTFTWSAGAGATAYWLDAGSSAGGNQYYQSGNLGNTLTTTVSGLPTDGSMVFVTLYSFIGGTWTGNAYTYTAFSATGGLAVIQTPIPGSMLSGTSATFTWSADPSATAYWLDIGNVAGGNQFYQSGNLGNVTTTNVFSLPADGSMIFTTLYSFVGGQWLSTSATYMSNP
jgi:hypothetical protein